MMSMWYEIVYMRLSWDLVDANPRRISSDCGSVCIEVGIVLAVILTL